MQELTFEVTANNNAAMRDVHLLNESKEMTDESGLLLGQTEWAKFPVNNDLGNESGKKFYIDTRAYNSMPCPSCKTHGEHSVLTFKGTDMVIIGCSNGCKQFSFCK